MPKPARLSGRGWTGRRRGAGQIALGFPDGEVTDRDWLAMLDGRSAATEAALAGAVLPGCRLACAGEVIAVVTFISVLLNVSPMRALRHPCLL